MSPNRVEVRDCVELSKIKRMQEEVSYLSTLLGWIHTFHHSIWNSTFDQVEIVSINSLLSVKDAY